MMGAQALGQGEGDEERITWILELQLGATSHSLLLLTMTTVSRLRSWGSSDGSGGVPTAAAAAAAAAL